MKRRQKIRKSIILVSFFLFPATFYYLSPYLIIEGTANRIVSGSFLLFSLQFFSALVVGRAFCGWVCPAAGAQEIIIYVSKTKVKTGNLIKWFIWVPWIVVIILVAFQNGGYNKIDPFYNTTFGLSMSDIYALFTYLGVMLLIVLPAFLVGRRSFCHHICWMAPFMIIGRKIRNLINVPSLQLSSKSDQCIHCHSCTETCPMSLPVEVMVNRGKMENKECILCGSCVDGCKSGVIGFGFGRLR